MIGGSSTSSQTKDERCPEEDGFSTCFIVPVSEFSSSDVQPISTSINECTTMNLLCNMSVSLDAPPSELVLSMVTSPSDGSADSELTASLVPGNSSSMTTGFLPFLDFLRCTPCLESSVPPLRSSPVSSTQPWSIRRNSAITWSDPRKYKS